MTVSTCPKLAPNPALHGAQSRYAQVAQTLFNEIESGRYPVGTQLPTEFALCEQFGVSRITIREAIKRLVDMGLVTRQPRIGTTVLSLKASTGYRQSVADVSDLYQYVTDTTLVIESCETVEINEQRAFMLEAVAGETWLHLRGRRYIQTRTEPTCLTELWIHPMFRSVQGINGALHSAVHAAIEQQFGEIITMVEQEIRATALTKSEAQMLDAPEGSPAPWVSRRYRNRLAQLVELAISTHPANRFSHTTVLPREWGVGTTEGTA